MTKEGSVYLTLYLESSACIRRITWRVRARWSSFSAETIEADEASEKTLI
jgi:hypothetical protein